ncbi:MAG: nucleotidyltransferase [Thermoplasmata archaeon HGW-Thermoplasmata-2]|nr:MAG: nucleotidyltransferase [Thermoplasmata archaeon HGW-Thermoplasmata-2]
MAVNCRKDVGGKVEEFSLDDIIATLKRNKKVLRKYGIRKIGIFGSYVRGEQKKRSDIDILVEFEEGEKSYDNYIDACFFLEEALGKEVDLLTMEGISPYIKPHILREVVFT